MVRPNIAQCDRLHEHAEVHEYIVRLASLACEIPCTDMSPLHRDVAIDAVLDTALEDLFAYHERDPGVRPGSGARLRQESPVSRERIREAMSRDIQDHYSENGRLIIPMGAYVIRVSKP